MDWEELHKQVTTCRRCSRLVEWRENVARMKTRRFQNWEYWGKPVPGFGDPRAQLWIIGLAPAAHGGNRTGRVFTGDRSGDWLFRALYRAGFSNQPESESRQDGLQLTSCYISAVVRCAPPGNKPLAEEFQNCQSFLMEEFKLLTNLRIILCLGQLSFKHTLAMIEEFTQIKIKPRPKFAHGLELPISPRLTLLTSYHPSQQNTFTGKLTEEMFDEIFNRIRKKINSDFP
ncbi:MAG: uracil-DNA glycosylase family protein [Calditrichia bacterium]